MYLDANAEKENLHANLRQHCSTTMLMILQEVGVEVLKNKEEIITVERLLQELNPVESVTNVIEATPCCADIQQVTFPYQYPLKL